MNRLRRIQLASVGVLAGGLIVTVGLLRYEPAFLREQAVFSPGHDVAANPTGLAASSDPAASASQRTAGRMVTKASALHAAIGQSGDWGTAVTDDEINAWLAIDLPRNHQGWLPHGVSEPRVLFLPGHVQIGARFVYAGLSAAAWLDLEIHLRDVNQVGIVLADARVGLIPLPRGAILRELARCINGLGRVTELRQLNGRTVLIVSMASTRETGGMIASLESLRIGDGEAMLTGTTRSAANAGRSDRNKQNEQTSR